MTRNRPSGTKDPEHEQTDLVDPDDKDDVVSLEAMFALAKAKYINKLKLADVAAQAWSRSAKDFKRAI